MKKTVLFLSLAIVCALGCSTDDPEPETKRTTIYDTVLTTLTVYDTVRVPIMCDHSWVVYVLNNGTDEVDTLDIKNGASIKLKSDASRFGYDFVKWSTSPTGGGKDYVAGDNFYVDKDITLYAIWQSHDGLRSNELYDFLAKQEEGSTVDVKIIDIDPNFNAIGTALKKFWKVNVNLDLGDATGVTNLYCDYTNLKSIVFPPNVQSLQLSGCSGLIKLDNIPASVQSLFISCANLSTLIIPNEVTYLEVRGCSQLTSIDIPNSVTQIGSFEDNSSLTEITIPASVESAFLTFTGCTNLKTVKHSLKECTGVNFKGCKKLTSIILPEFRPESTDIGSYAFHNCSSLTSLTIPECVTSIGASAFAECTSLTSITIPEGVTSIGATAFACCTSLTSLKFKATTPPTLEYWINYFNTIYVPSSAVDAYKTADVWKDYAEQIVGY